MSGCSRLWPKGIEQLEQMKNRYILDGLGELLTEPQKDWAKAKLRKDTIFLLKNYQSVLK